MIPDPIDYCVITANQVKYGISTPAGTLLTHGYIDTYVSWGSYSKLLHSCDVSTPAQRKGIVESTPRQRSDMFYASGYDFGMKTIINIVVYEM